MQCNCLPANPIKCKIIQCDAMKWCPGQCNPMQWQLGMVMRMQEMQIFANIANIDNVRRCALENIGVRPSLMPIQWPTLWPYMIFNLDHLCTKHCSLLCVWIEFDAASLVSVKPTTRQFSLVNCAALYTCRMITLQCALIWKLYVLCARVERW